jgi:GMP synthase PP-ATPase subunit
MINRLRKIRTARFVERFQDTDADVKCKWLVPGTIYSVKPINLGTSVNCPRNPRNP